MTQRKSDDLRLVESVAQFARTVAKRSRTITAIYVQAPDEKKSPVDLGTDTLEAANEISETLYRVADLSGADASVIMIAVGKLLAKYATIFGEEPKEGEPEERGTENAVMLASAGFVLGLEAFIREVQEERENLDDDDDDDDDDEEVEDGEYDEYAEDDDLDDTDSDEEESAEASSNRVDLDTEEDDSSEPTPEADAISEHDDPDTGGKMPPPSSAGLAIKHQS